MTVLVQAGAEALLPAAVLVPFVGVLCALPLGGRRAAWVAAATIVAGGVIAAGIVFRWWAVQATLSYLLGGWAPPWASPCAPTGRRWR